MRTQSLFDTYWLDNRLPNDHLLHLNQLVALIKDDRIDTSGCDWNIHTTFRCGGIVNEATGHVHDANTHRLAQLDMDHAS